MTGRSSTISGASHRFDEFERVDEHAEAAPVGLRGEGGDVSDRERIRVAAALQRRLQLRVLLIEAFKGDYARGRPCLREPAFQLETLCTCLLLLESCALALLNVGQL